MIKTTVKENGFEGILFSGNGSKEKVIIVMSGSNGGMKLTEREARFYDKNGIPALALALFKTMQTGMNLDRVPVEYVEKAITWLKKQGYRKIGIDGASKGSEMALVAASMFPDISCVIAKVPSYFISEGLSANGLSKKPSGTSCWCYRGKELPFARYNSRTFDIKKLLLKEKELHIITYNRDKTVTPDTIIPVEKMNGPVLFISSKHDEVWDSYKSSVIMQNRLKKNGYRFPHKHYACNALSHAAMVTVPFIYKLAFKSERRHFIKCSRERSKLKRIVLDWVKNTWI